jgi:hypothetical protein
VTDTAKYGPWALIAGGSEGVGAEFALLLAQAGLNLVLVARTAAALEQTADLPGGQERGVHACARQQPGHRGLRGFDEPDGPHRGSLPRHCPGRVFLAGEGCRYLTGNTLFVDGGSHINGVAWTPDLDGAS